MSKRIDQVYLGDMLDAARRVAAKVSGPSLEDFRADENLQLAVVHLIQIIGEAANRVRPELRESHPDIPWNAVIGMRHRLVHDYGNINYDIVWSVAVEEMPKLIAAVERILPAEP